ncbi:MAG TPA: TRAP transporter large permease subunit, partial [Ramlibacter sp.]
IIVAKLKPSMAPPLAPQDRIVPLPPMTVKIGGTQEQYAIPALVGALKGRNNQGVPTGYLLRQLFVVFLPLLVFVFFALFSYRAVTEPLLKESGAEGLTRMGETSQSTESAAGGLAEPPASGGLAEPPSSGGLAEPPASGGLAEPPADGAASAPVAAVQAPAASAPAAAAEAASADKPAEYGEAREASRTWWITIAIFAILLAIYYALLSFGRLEIFKMLLTSFFPLLILILSVLGSIVLGLATPTEAAAVGALGGFLLAVAYRQLTFQVVKESVFLTAKTSAMVCWLFVGSAIFSAAFALLGGQELVERWVLSMNLTQVQFLLLSQVIIFILGWPLEWTEIIVIFMPIFVPLLPKFGVDPLFFGLLVALNLQTAFLSPPVAMAAFYLKGVSPPHVTLNQIFTGMLPFMGIQVLAIFLLYMWPQIGLWLPSVLYAK